MLEEENMQWFYISMNHPLPVTVLNSHEELFEYLCQHLLSEIIIFIINMSLKTSPRAVLQYEVYLIILNKPIIDFDYIWMIL